MQHRTGGASPTRLDAKHLLAYAAPAVPLQAMMIPLLLVLPPFYATEMGLGFATVGTLFLLGRLFEAASDPIIGSASDRTRSRFGRRRLWLVCSTPVALLAAWFLVFPPAGISAPLLLATIVVFYAGWTAVMIPYQAWGAELSDDYHERTRIAAAREGAAFVGYLVATLLPMLVLQGILGETTPGWGDISRVIGVFFVVALPLTLAALLWFVREPPPGTGAAVPWSAVPDVVRVNRPFRTLLGAYALDRIAFGVYMAVFPLLLQQVLQLQQYFLAVSLANSVAALAGAWLWPRIAQRIGKRAAYVAANALAAASYVALALLPAGVAWPAFVVLAAVGLSQPGTLILPYSMTADATDYYRWRRGASAPAVHVALLTLVFKLGLAIGIGATYSLLPRLGDAFGIGDSALRVVVGVGAPLLLVGTMLIASRYPIGPREHAVLQRATRRLERRAPAAPAGAAG